MIKTVTASGYNVVVAWMIRGERAIEFFEQVAMNNDLELVEVLLHTEKEDAVARCVARGFHPGGLLDRGGREILVAEMYDQMVAATNKRPNTIKVKSVLGDIEGTYKSLVAQLR